MTAKSEASQKRDQFNEFAKFVRFFSTRLVQSVVQARMGGYVGHPCCISPETSDWFNLRVDEIGETAAYLKSAVKKFPPYAPVLNLDFLLYTADRDLLPLESWVIRVNSNDVDEGVHVHSSLYHQMSTLLKSIMAAARVTPTYRYYVRKQSPETFVILYRVFEGEPDLDLLGEGQKYLRLGYLPSPFGSVNVDLHYRTRMEIVPAPYASSETKSERIEGSVTEDDDGSVFQQASIPVGAVVPPKGSKVVAVSPVGDDINSFSTSPLSQDIPFSSDPKGQFKLGRSSSSSESAQSRTQSSQQDDLGSAHNISSNSPRSPNSFPQRSSSYNTLRLRHNSFPFASLLMESQMTEKPGQLPKVPEDPGNGSHLERSSTVVPSSDKGTSARNSPEVEEQAPLPTDNRGASTSQTSTADNPASLGAEPKPEGEEEDEIESSDDSYVKVFAFAGLDESADIGGDLTDFVKEFRLAPEDLPSFFQEHADKIAKQLEEFKGKAGMFDSFVSGLKEKDEE